MEIDITGAQLPQAYKILSGLIVPRPIALITTMNQAGQVNAAPFSYFNLFGSSPPLVVVSPGNREDGAPKDTAANIIANGEFVVHLVDEKMGVAMNVTADDLPHGENELHAAGLTEVPSQKVTPPRIKEAPVAMECEVHDIVEVGSNRLVIGLVKWVSVRDGILDENFSVIDGSFQPIARMHGGGWYTRTQDLFEIGRP